MAERFDLNALRAMAGAPRKEGEDMSDPQAQVLSETLDRSKQLNEGPLETRIEAHAREIARLEAAVAAWESPLARFDALSPEEQRAHMANELRSTVPEAEWDMVIYRNGLMQQSRKNPDALRRAFFKQQLERLRAELETQDKE